MCVLFYDCNFKKNCPDFYRKYFIRDFHQLDTYPVYFFAASSPFVKYAVSFNETDRRIVQNLVDSPIDDRFNIDSVDEDPLEQLEKFQAKTRHLKEPNLTVFDEAHANMPLKEYIRKWSNWVIDFHWIFTLKYFIEFLPTNKLHFFIKNYPSLDNFILHWMWWSYSLNKDLERFTKDSFRAIGSMPWLCFDVTNEQRDKCLDNTASHYQQTTQSLSTSDEKKPATAQQARQLQLEKAYEQKLMRHINQLAHENSQQLVPKQPSKFFQYNEFTIKTICSLLFKSENSKQKYDRSKVVDKLINENRTCGGGVTGVGGSAPQLKKLARSNSCSNADDISIPMKILLELNQTEETGNLDPMKSNVFDQDTADTSTSFKVRV